ncbi:MAG: tetratricopeptide repeat protein [Candidatus Lloydbacteria bacterium]|nr:tetratricopeptide repeat protein [Candidatus Lloydbacteria bacterium]
MDIKIPVSKSEMYCNGDIPRQKDVPAPSTAAVPKEDILDRASFWIVLSLVFLLPVFFLPIGNLSIFFSKNFLLSIAVLAVAVLWFIARLKKGELEIPKTSLFLSGALILVIFLIASLLSPALRASLIGVGSEIGTFFSLFILFFLLFFSSLFFQSKKRMLLLYTALAASFLSVALFQIVRLVGGPTVLSFGFFNDTASNLLGRWNELAVFFGMAVVWALLSLGMFPSQKYFRWFLYFLLVISTLLVALVNFPPVWMVLGAFALLVFVYTFSSRKDSGRFGGEQSGIMPVISLLLLGLSIAALFSTSIIGNFVSSTFHIEHFEARPTLETTFSIFKQTINDHPVFGVSPNRFTNQWLLLKPNGVNASPFWNVDFAFGISTIATFAVTSGIAGLLAWIVFLVSILSVGLRTFFDFSTDRLAHYLVVSSFILSLYLWIFMAMYVPSNALMGLTFLLTGAWIGFLTSLGVYKQYTFLFSKNPQRNFISVLVLLVLIIGSITGGYVVWQKFYAAVLFEQSSALFAAGEIPAASAKMERAAQLGDHALYFRSLADIDIARLGVIMNGKNLTIDEARSQFQTILSAAIDNARQAIAYDPTDYLNVVSLARVYESVVPLGITGAYENSKRAYEEALKYNPKSPALELGIARLSLAQGNRDEARTHIAKALALKNNYTDAIFLLSRIEADEGKISDAISSAEIASLISPNDTGLFFHLGLLRYTNKDYQGAISALERAVLLQPNYANAKYFLGLSYEQVGKRADAIIQFQDLEKTNAGNEDVKKILANLRAGKHPFAGGETSPPEKGKNPPIREE